MEFGRMMWIGLTLLAIHAPLTLAASEENGSRPLTLHGYGSLGAVYHDATGVEYRRDIAQPVKGENANRLLFDRDSMLGVQADYRGNDAFSASLQMLARQDADADFTPQVSMAFLKYHDGDYQIRAGRLIIETYMAGDAAEVGYANLMVRQPLIFYPRYMDGLDAEVTTPQGEGLLRVKGLAGVTPGQVISLNGNQDLSGSKLLGIGAEYARGDWAARLVMATLEIAKELPEMMPGGALSTVLLSVPNGTALRDVLTMQRRLDVGMLELSYDCSGWQGHAVYAITRSRGWEDLHSVYINGGYRMGMFTPYASFSYERMPRTLLGSGVPDGLSAQTDALNQALSEAEAAHILNVDDFALGVRYDFMRNRALKVQWDRIRYRDPASVMDRSLSGLPVASRGFKTMNLYSVVLDFVF